MQKQAASLDLRTTIGNYQFRFSNSFDQEARDFEDQKIKNQTHSKITIVNGDNNELHFAWPKLSYWQSYRFFVNQSEPYYFLQMSNLKQSTFYQLVIRVETSSISHFKIGIIEKWAVNPIKEHLLDLNILIDRLHFYLRNHTNIMSIRVKPYMPGESSVQNIHSLLRQRGFKDASPTSYVKTRMINLLPSNEELLKSFSANGRARLKIKENDKDKIEIKEVREHIYIPHLQKALNASFKRSANKDCPYNFTPLLKSENIDVHMLGFFLKQEDAPKAFATGVYHQNIAEFSVGGSLEDPSLRQYPFNHLLLWNLALKAKAQGLELFDMGGITSGDETDPLKGITNFKRLFPGFEIQTGNEMLKVIRPRTHAFYSVLQKTARWIAS
jgi:lipid II:glycine glycyltransferase (peptidoglycan interpeptide bridge formation enzyme)